MGSTTECVVCFKPQQNYLCDNCIQTVRHSLCRSGWLMGDVETTICRLDDVGSQVKVRSKSDEFPLVFNWSADHDKDSVISTLHSWIRDIDHTDLPDDEALQFVWLAEHADKWRNSDMAFQFYDEIIAMGQVIEQAVDIPQDRIPLGYCGEPHEWGVCEVKLWAKDLTADSVRCKACGTRHDMATRLSEAESTAHDRILGLPDIALLLEMLRINVTYDQLRQWMSRHRKNAERELFESVTTDRWGRSMYRFKDVLDEIRRRASRPRKKSA